MIPHILLVGFTDMESDEELELRATANDREADPSGTVGTEVIYISDDKY